MKKKSKYSYPLKQYSPAITKDQFYKICKNSKRTAKYLLDSGRKTRKYKIGMSNVIRYLEERARSRKI